LNFLYDFKMSFRGDYRPIRGKRNSFLSKDYQVFACGCGLPNPLLHLNQGMVMLGRNSVGVGDIS
jgi:hypothetical protein